MTEMCSFTVWEPEVQNQAVAGLCSLKPLEGPAWLLPGFRAHRPSLAPWRVAARLPLCLWRPGCSSRVSASAVFLLMRTPVVRDQGPFNSSVTLTQLTSYISHDCISKEVHVLRFWERHIPGDTVSAPCGLRPTNPS